MFNAIHTLIYSDDPTAPRAFLRDVLDWLYVDDPGSGAGLAHLQERAERDGSPSHDPTRTGARPTLPTSPSISLIESAIQMCDDVEATRAALEGKGPSSRAGSRTWAWARDDAQAGRRRRHLLYQPKHPEAHSL